MTSRATGPGPSDDVQRPGSARPGGTRGRQPDQGGEPLDRLARRDLVLLRMQAGRRGRRRPARGHLGGLAAEGLTP